MTPRTSVRAAARRLYEEMSGEGGLSRNLRLPTPDPSPPLASLAGEGERDVRVAGVEPDPPSLRFGGQDLMAHVRRMYEDSIIPVRDIAQRAGVTERTLYKYAGKNNWKPRYAWTPDGSRPPPRRRPARPTALPSVRSLRQNVARRRKRPARRCAGSIRACGVSTG